ncbi:MAG: thrombospondin type 3 repeat-containing protein [Roseibacillus sp.]
MRLVLVLLPTDESDLDQNGDFLEPLPLDLIANERFASGNVGQGACEFTSGSRLDSDGDGLSDEFELTHSGNAVLMDAESDLDGDGLTALAEYLHGENPNAALRHPIAALSTLGVNGQSCLTITYHIDPLALAFVSFEVQRCYLLNSPDGWRKGETVLVFSRVSPTNPDLLEIVERALFPIGTEWSEFLRIRHETIGGKAANPYDPAGLLEQTQGDSERFR